MRLVAWRLLEALALALYLLQGGPAAVYHSLTSEFRGVIEEGTVEEQKIIKATVVG